MTSSQLTLAVDTWTCQAVSVSRFLLALYRRLGDEKQAANAIQAGAPAEERGGRLGLGPRIAALKLIHGQEAPDAAPGEARSWQVLVEAQAGVCAFHAMADHCDDGKARSLRGARTANNKAFQASLRGYRIAFPEEMSAVGISEAIDAAAETCLASFLEDLTDASDEERESIRKDLGLTIREALAREAEVGRA